MVPNACCLPENPSSHIRLTNTVTLAPETVHSAEGTYARVIHSDIHTHTHTHTFIYTCCIHICIHARSYIKIDVSRIIVNRG